MRKVDELGRIVIPAELRRKYAIKEGEALAFFDTNDGILMRVAEQMCRVCQEKLSDSTDFPLCNACLAEAAKRYQEKNVTN